MTLFRYVTPALHGRWFPTREDALYNALQAGQARRLPWDGGVSELSEFSRLKEDDQDCALFSPSVVPKGIYLDMPG